MCAKALRVASLALITLAGTTRATPPNVRVVDDSALPGGDGQSWAAAYNDLQAALDEAVANSTITEVWIAAGTYVPSRRTDPVDSLSATFTLLNHVAIYG